jgi:hypothetical protein
MLTLPSSYIVLILTFNHSLRLLISVVDAQINDEYAPEEEGEEGESPLSNPVPASLIITKVSFPRPESLSSPQST